MSSTIPALDSIMCLRWIYQHMFLVLALFLIVVLVKGTFCSRPLCDFSGQQSFIFILPSDDNGSAATEPLGDNVYQITLPANDESLQASMHRQPWNQPSQWVKHGRTPLVPYPWASGNHLFWKRNKRETSALLGLQILILSYLAAAISSSHYLWWEKPSRTDKMFLLWIK